MHLPRCTESAEVHWILSCPHSCPQRTCTQGRHWKKTDKSPKKLELIYAAETPGTNMDLCLFPGKAHGAKGPQDHEKPNCAWCSQIKFCVNPARPNPFAVHCHYLEIFHTVPSTTHKAKQQISMPIVLIALMESRIKIARTQKNYADNQSKYKFCTVTTHLLFEDFLGFLWIYNKQTQKTWNIVSTLSLPAFHTANASRDLKIWGFPSK